MFLEDPEMPLHLVGFPGTALQTHVCCLVPPTSPHIWGSEVKEMPDHVCQCVVLRLERLAQELHSAPQPFHMVRELLVFNICMNYSAYPL